MSSVRQNERTFPERSRSRSPFKKIRIRSQSATGTSAGIGGSVMGVSRARAPHAEEAVADGEAGFDAALAHRVVAALIQRGSAVGVGAPSIFESIEISGMSAKCT
jgi:hypothetical protein